MMVTAIRSVTKQKFQVEIDGQLAFVLYKGELSHYNIKEEEELPEAVYEEIVGTVLTKRAKLYAMHLLQKTDRTEAELEQKLTKAGYPKEVTQTAIDYVKSYGYVNDQEYARRYVLWNKENKGKNRIRMELYQKGVPKPVIDSVLEESDFSGSEEQIRALIQKKKKEPGPLSEKEFRRLYGFLARKGYENGLILQILREEGTYFE